jgi:hypothetical protein
MDEASQLLLVALLFALATPLAAAPATEVIVLPGASSAEGIAAGRGTTFYAGDLFAGDIFRGNLQRGTAELFVDAPAGRTATGATVAAYQLADPAGSFINDVTVTQDGAWFTDSLQAQLYFVRVSAAGPPGPPTTLPLRGPAADTSGEFNLNGIAVTTNGKTLIVGHSGTGRLYTVDPISGTSATIAGVSVPDVDGIVLAGRRLWAAQNLENQIARIRLAPDLTSGVVEGLITSELFQTPTTAARIGRRLAGVDRVLGVEPQAAEDLVHHAPLVVQGEPNQPQRVGGNRCDRGPVVGIVVGAEQLLGEDAQAHLVGDRAGVRGGELLGGPDEHQHGLDEHGQVLATGAVLVRLADDLVAAGGHRPRQERGHVQLLPGRQVVADDDGELGVEAHAGPPSAASDAPYHRERMRYPS